MALIIKTTGIEDYLDGGEAYVKALILGPPDAGKTRSASYWPKPIFADCEKGRMSIADRAVPYAEITSTADMDALLAMLKLECKKPVAQRKYQTLVIDTVDAYQRIVIQERLDAEKKEALSGWGDWGYLDGKMTQLVEKLHQLSMNIVVNVHVKDQSTGDDDSRATVTGVKLKGDFKDQIAAEFDLVGLMGKYYEAEGGQRVLKRGIKWHSDPTTPLLKDRSGQLPKFTPVSFSGDDYANLFGTLIGHLDTLRPSENVEELETDPAITAKPVPPQAGGPVPGAPVAPPAKKKAAAPKSQAAKNAAKTAEAAPAADPTPTPVASNVPAAPKPAAVPAAPKPEVPAQREPEEASGAESAPEPEAAAVPEPEAVPATEAAETPAEATTDEALSPEAVAEALGGEVISDSTTAEDAATGEADDAAPAEVAEVEQQTAPKCGTSSNEGEEGQPGSVPGCGADVDVDADMTQIAMFKTRTYLCPADYAAWRAATKK